MINGHRNISERAHGAFGLPLIGLVDMVAEQDWDQAEHLAETILKMARLNRLERAADGMGVLVPADLPI